MENVYRIKTYPRFTDSYLNPYIPASGHVTFESHSGSHPLPSPLFLEVHAAIARILHATGMGEAIDKSLEERINICCLANNWSTDIERLLLAF